MNLLKNKFATLCLDERYPRILWFEGSDGTRIQGEALAAAPRLYLFRKSDLATLTTDDANVRANYKLVIEGIRASYEAHVEIDGTPAADFDVRVDLDGDDAVIAMEHVREHGIYRFLTMRLPHIVSADSTDKDSLTVTCGWQGRLLDPKKCKPCMYDYSWHGSTARMCGASYRPGFMVTFDLPGYEDLLIQEVWQYTRISGARTLASLGAEMMHRQRNVEGAGGLVKQPPAWTHPHVKPLDEPILCAKSKEIRLHFIARKGKTLDWTDAARYFQMLVPKSWHPDQRYDNTLVYKNCPCGYKQPFMTFEQIGDIIRKVRNLTDGMKQVCYMPFFQYHGGDSGHPRMEPIYPPVGDKNMLLKVIKEVEKYDCILSFHDNLDQADLAAPWFDPKSISRDSTGQFFSGGYWGGVQLVQVSLPEAMPKIKKRIAKVVKTYGIHTTYHLDTHSGDCYRFDASPRHPYNATAFVEARFEMAREFEKHGVNLTSECLMHPYLSYLGHVWALFNWGTLWEGEAAVPFANFIYHGTASWNSGNAGSEESILNALIQGGGSGVEFPNSKWPEVIDSLYLIQPVYMALRQRKWTGYSHKGSLRRVEHGTDSYIEVDDEKKTYDVVIDGRRFARNFATVFPSPSRKGAWLAFSRRDCDLDWPVPAGIRNGPLKIVELTESGDGLRLEGEVKGGRLKLSLKASVPVRIRQ